MTRPASLLLALLAGLGLAVGAAKAQTCNFANVKQHIDRVIDRDPELGALFRKEFKEGYDSIAILEKLLGEETARQIDICRFDAAEYLTKRGFPPAH